MTPQSLLRFRLTLGAMVLLGLSGGTMVAFAAPPPAKSTGHKPAGKAQNVPPKAGSNRLGGVIGPQLGLSTAQQARVVAIVKRLNEKQSAVRKNAKLNPTQKQEQCDELQLTAQDEIANLMTPAQKQKLVEIRRRQMKQGAAATGLQK